MAKRLCKLNRHEIADNLGNIHAIVSEAKYLCRSCARSSSEKSRLCKPSAIPPLSCQAKSNEEKQQSAVLAEGISPQNTGMDVNPDHENALLAKESENISKKAIKKAKKEAKKQKKQLKEMKKIARKQSKLLLKQKKIEKRFSELNALYSVQETHYPIH